MSLGVGGFQIKRLADSKAEIEALAGDTFGVENIDLAPDGPFGQFIGILADREAAWYELLEQVIASTSEAGASGSLLDQLLLLVNMFRLPAKPSRTIASDGVTPTTELTGTPTTLVAAGFVITTNDTGARFLLKDDATIGVGGTVLAEFVSEDNGAVVALAGTLTEIAVPLAGLDSVTNLQDAQPGRLVETDTAFRSRRVAAATAVASCTVPALLAALLAVEDVEEAKLIVNRSDSPDLDGRPGHSFEAVVRGGVDDDIRAAVYAAQPAAIESFGTVTGTVTDPHGDLQEVNHSRPTAVPIYFDVALTVDGAFPTDGVTQVRDAILAYEDVLRAGLTVAAFKIEQTIETPGIVSVVFRLGRGPNPGGTDPITMGGTEIGDIDSTRTNVYRVN